jgi:hypothetical protein
MAGIQAMNKKAGGSRIDTVLLVPPNGLRLSGIRAHHVSASIE